MPGEGNRSVIYRRAVVMLVISVIILAVDIVLITAGYTRAKLNYQSEQPFEQLAYMECRGETAYLDIAAAPVKANGVKNNDKKNFNYYIVSDGKNIYVISTHPIIEKKISETVANDGKMRVVGSAGKMSEKTRSAMENICPDLDDRMLSELYVPLGSGMLALLTGPHYNFTVYITVLITAAVMLLTSIVYAIMFKTK